MKLSALFVAVVAAAKKDLTGTEQLDKLRGHVNGVWDMWYSVGCAKRAAKKVRFLGLIQRLEDRFDNCGADSTPGVLTRRRRSDETGGDEDGASNATSKICPTQEASDECLANIMCIDETCEIVRISKTDKGKANKQLGNIMVKFVNRYFNSCVFTKTNPKFHKDNFPTTAQKWTTNMNRLKCAGGPGRQ